MKQYTDMADISMGGIVEMALNNGVSRQDGQADFRENRRSPGFQDL